MQNLPASARKRSAAARKAAGQSMQGELSRLLVVIIAADLIIIGLLTWLWLGPFYKQFKIRTMKDAYSKLVEMSNDVANLSDEVMEMSVRDNIMILMTNSDLSDPHSTKQDARRNSTRLFGYVSGLYSDRITVLKKTDEYTLQETTDSKINTNYLEMWGQLDNGYWFLLQTPLESMTESVRLTLIFYTLVGVITILASLFIIPFIMKRYTRPIKQLTDLSRRMAAMDFGAKYTGEEQNEIGALGESFNKMSAGLEASISELKSVNAELQKDNERKTQIDEVRKEFLNNVSHELKTPLALIQGYAEGLKDNIAEDPESRDFYLDVIIDEASKMNSMVRKLLTLNQIEFGNDPVRMEYFDLHEVIDGVIAGMSLIADSQGVTIRYASDGPVMVWGDSFKIEEVLTNYLSNAVNHAEGRKEIDVRTERQGDTVKVTVRNTGSPIPESDLPHVFEKFYKVDKARTRAYGGSGIGLSIVKAIMDGHNQACGAENLEDGVEFWFTLDAGTSAGPAGAAEKTPD